MLILQASNKTILGYVRVLKTVVQVSEDRYMGPELYERALWTVAGLSACLNLSYTYNSAHT